MGFGIALTAWDSLQYIKSTVHKWENASAFTHDSNTTKNSQTKDSRPHTSAIRAVRQVRFPCFKMNKCAKHQINHLNSLKQTTTVRFQSHRHNNKSTWRYDEYADSFRGSHECLIVLWSNPFRHQHTPSSEKWHRKDFREMTVVVNVVGCRWSGSKFPENTLIVPRRRQIMVIWQSWRQTVWTSV